MRVLIVGAGPCGLAAAREFSDRNNVDWTLIEREPFAGGLGGSVTDARGFTWDFGGHVVFSHYGEFDRLVDEVMGNDLLEHDRISYIRVGDRRVPYPFQNNLRYLHPSDVLRCLAGLVDAKGASPDEDFKAWILGTFGEGIASVFMFPYNRKVWATPLGDMSARWIGERVSVVDWKRALRNVIEGRDDVAWGPNNRFRFPAQGGTGEVFRRIAHSLGNRIRYSLEVVAVDAERREIALSDGTSESYDALISTMPLDQLVGRIKSCPSSVKAASECLEHNSVTIIGLGYETPLTGDSSWEYFPGDDVPFYRVVNFAKFSPANVPGRDIARYSSFLTETAHSRHRGLPVGLEKAADLALRHLGLVPRAAPLASVHRIEIDYAYPIPTLGRDSALAAIHPWLMSRGIYSRGRFGSWRYEIGNMDHAVKMGIDIARRIGGYAPEQAWSL